MTEIDRIINLKGFFVMLRNKFRIACLMAFQTVVAVASTSAPSTTPVATATTTPATVLVTAPVMVASASTTAPAVAAAGTPAAPESVVSLRNCSYENGLLGDSNAPIRDFCLSQSTDINTGKAHKAIDFALGYYAAMKCTAASSVLDGNCKNAANTIANGVALAFHLDYTTLHKIRSAVPPGSTGGCPCAAAS